MQWLLTPLDKHSDDGFGAMATAFKGSAETLMAAEKDSMASRELPTCFLLRHAAELFLKSALVVSHRRLTASKDRLPAIPVADKLKPLTAVHDLRPLYGELVALLTRQQAELEAVAKTKWLPMPVELDQAIVAIGDMDARGVFFRYPTETNSAKSANKPISADELSNWDQNTQGFLRAFVVVDQNDEFVEAFHFQPDILAQELETLKAACYWLNCIHLGLRMELAGGW